MDDNVIGIIVQVLTVAAVGFGLWYSVRNMTAAVEAKLDKLDERVTAQIAALDKKVTGQIAALDERVTAQIAALDEKFTGQIGTR